MEQLSTTLLATQYAELDQAIKSGDEALKKLKDRRSQLELQLQQRFVDEGVSSIRTQKGLVYLYRQIWASCSEVNVLAETDWGWMAQAKVSSQTLSAEVRLLEKDDEGQPILPEEMKDCINVTEKWFVRVRGK